MQLAVPAAPPAGQNPVRGAPGVGIGHRAGNRRAWLGPRRSISTFALRLRVESSAGTQRCQDAVLPVVALRSGIVPPNTD